MMHLCYISGVDDDRLWVHYKLLTELENVYGFRLCIHHRNFRAGVDIIDNIAQAIRTSRKVLVVMSPILSEVTGVSRKSR